MRRTLKGRGASKGAHYRKTYNKYIKHYSFMKRVWLARVKHNVPCVECGGIFHPVSMDFDHVEGVKNFSISAASSSTAGLDAICEEISKCALVCANCHRVRSHKAYVTEMQPYLDDHTLEYSHPDYKPWGNTLAKFSEKKPNFANTVE